MEGLGAHSGPFPILAIDDGQATSAARTRLTGLRRYHLLPRGVSHTREDSFLIRYLPVAKKPRFVLDHQICKAHNQGVGLVTVLFNGRHDY